MSDGVGFTIYHILYTIQDSRPESGLERLACAKFARQRRVLRLVIQRMGVHQQLVEHSGFQGLFFGAAVERVETD